MGKFPPSMRGAKLPINALVNKTPSQPQSLTENPPYWAAKKSPKKKPTKLPSEVTPQLPAITFNSPNLSEAKTLFNQLISTPGKTPSDLKLCNSVLESFSSRASLQDSIFFLNHMIKTHPSFSPDSSTYNVLLVQSCKANDFSISSVHQVLNYMSSQGFPPNKVSTDIAVRTLCSCGREEDAIELVKDLSGRAMHLGHWHCWGKWKQRGVILMCAHITHCFMDCARQGCWIKGLNCIR